MAKTTKKTRRSNRVRVIPVVKPLVREAWSVNDLLDVFKGSKRPDAKPQLKRIGTLDAGGNLTSNYAHWGKITPKKVAIRKGSGSASGSKARASKAVPTK